MLDAMISASVRCGSQTRTYSTFGRAGGPCAPYCHITENSEMVTLAQATPIRQRFLPACWNTIAKSAMAPRGLTWRQKLEGRINAMTG